ncbi:sensitivity to red-light reduced protein [Linnemannia zychae]|nr:sensitivity to red-light reduced protein [Linnemannia zychae]
MMGSIGVDQEERTLEWGQCLIDERILTLKQSKFYQAFRAQATLCEPCKKLQKPTATQQQSATTLEDSLGEEIGDLKTQEDKPVSDTPIPVGEQLGIEIVDMICYGIGSIESSRNAQFQLAMAICLKEVLQLSGTLSIFDPIMTSYDNKLVEHYGFKVLTGDGRSRQPVKVKTLYFMPHCPKGLYSLVLETNWSRECLDNTVILGNRFTMYDESLSFKQLVNQAPFILPALSISQISLLPAIKFEDNTAFNDLGFHCFPPDQALPEIDLTDREVDPELL